MCMCLCLCNISLTNTYFAMYEFAQADFVWEIDIINCVVAAMSLYYFVWYLRTLRSIRIRV